MKLFMSFLLLPIISLMVISCGKGDSEAEEQPSSDYRLEWVGEYTGTKSFKSYEDDPFAQEITFDVSVDPESEDGMLINEILLPIDVDGTYGPDYEGNTFYEVTFNGDEIRMKIHESIPNGIVLPCWIKAAKG